MAKSFSQIAKSGEFEHHPTEAGLLVKVTPEGRIVFKNVGSNKEIGNTPVEVDGADVYALGVSKNPPKITAGGYGPPDVSPIERWGERLKASFEAATKSYMDTPEKKALEDVQKTLKEKGLTAGEKGGEFISEKDTGKYTFSEDGQSLKFSGGRERATGKPKKPSSFRLQAPPSETDTDPTPSSPRSTGSEEGFMWSEDKTKGTSTRPEGTVIDPITGAATSPEASLDLTKDRIAPIFDNAPSGTTRDLLRNASVAPEGTSSAATATKKPAGFLSQIRKMFNQQIKEAVDGLKKKNEGETSAPVASAPAPAPAVTRGSSGSGSGLDYLRSREAVKEMDRAGKADIGGRQRERRLGAEARFRERKDFIETGRKLREKLGDPNIIKGSEGEELGRVIKDSTGKIIGSSLNKKGRAALGNRKGAGVIDGGVVDAADFKGTDAQRTLAAYAAMDKRDSQIADMEAAQKGVTNLFYGGPNKQQQNRIKGSELIDRFSKGSTTNEGKPKTKKVNTNFPLQTKQDSTLLEESPVTDAGSVSGSIPTVPKPDRPINLFESNRSGTVAQGSVPPANIPPSAVENKNLLGNIKLPELDNSGEQLNRTLTNQPSNSINVNQGNVAPQNIPVRSDGSVSPENVSAKSYTWANMQVPDAKVIYNNKQKGSDTPQQVDTQNLATQNLVKNLRDKKSNRNRNLRGSKG